ncbi:MAG TPA: hypothetical protein PKH09_07490 [Parvularculaceae bacterium]|nr:hypothetical protein [Parvularculaceae bacterium]
MIDRFGLIIGAMKAGTTTLFDHLARHPQIAGANPKEPGFFAFDDVYAKGRGWYEGLFAFDPAVHRIALDASTDYAKYPHCGDVPARLRNFGGEFRLVYSLRNPLRRIESHAQHVQSRRREVGRIDSDRPDHSLDAGVSLVSMDVSRYALQLDQYRDYFDRGGLMITSVERLAADPMGVTRAVAAHFGLDPDLLPAEVERRNRAAASAPARATHPLWRAAASVAPLKAAVKAVAPKGLLQKLRLKTRPRVEAKGRFSLTGDEEAAIIDALRGDLLRLRDVYGFDAEKEWGIGL